MTEVNVPLFPYCVTLSHCLLLLWAKSWHTLKLYWNLLCAKLEEW